MKTKPFFIFILTLVAVISPQISFAQDFLPEGAITRFGKGKINQILYTFDGDPQLLIASSIGVWHYNVETGEELPLLRGYTVFVSSIALAPDGQTHATGEQSGTVQLWDIRTGDHIAVLGGYTDPVTAVAYSPDGSTVANGSRDNTVRLWNTDTRQLKRTLTGHLRHLMAVAFSPDGLNLASSSEDSTVRRIGMGKRSG